MPVTPALQLDEMERNVRLVERQLDRYIYNHATVDADRKLADALNWLTKARTLIQEAKGERAIAEIQEGQ